MIDIRGLPLRGQLSGVRGSGFGVRGLLFGIRDSGLIIRGSGLKNPPLLEVGKTKRFI